MIEFQFDSDVVPRVIEELRNANEFIRIAVFQLHHADMFAALNDKLRQGIRVEILTLPYDSIKEKTQREVTRRFQTLEQNGAKLHFCKWNVGDPKRTTTAEGRWYAFHGKFIVTDTCAIALSANFTQAEELDAAIIYKDERDKISEFVGKFEELVRLFVTESSGNEGTVRQLILDTDQPGISSVFNAPRAITNDTHRNHWILHYPSSLCPEDSPIETRLYLTPFDCRGRNFVEQVISTASDFAYISTESFTDQDFPRFLINMRLRGLDVKILSGATSMDFSHRMQEMLRGLLAQNIDIRTTEQDIHAKLVVTDKHLMVSSVNLNRMNLGFAPKGTYWRENTETITVCDDPNILAIGKTQFVNVFNESVPIEHKLAERMEKTVGKVLSSTFALRSKKEVKRLFAEFVVTREIETKRVMFTVGKIVAKPMLRIGTRMVGKRELFLALILYYLSERKRFLSELTDALKALDQDADVGDLVRWLMDNQFIEQVDDSYKIKIEALL